jgi:hypothetical protein
MQQLSQIRAYTIVGICLLFSFGVRVDAQTQSEETKRGEVPVTNHAKGTFDVKLSPQEAGDQPFISRLLIDKQFHGDLEGSSTGQMLAASTETKGSAGYVAIERVNGKLGDRNGVFVLQHSGIMDHGEGRLTITVVPDSGTGQLAGLSGQMKIEIKDGKHFYEFEYTLPESR